jgi:predicted component of type VI protein secretion system
MAFRVVCQPDRRFLTDDDPSAYASAVAMTARPRRTHRTRRAPAALAYRAPRQPRLAPGELRALVLAHLRAHPHLDFTPRELGRVLNRSPGGIRAVCQRLVAEGLARCTNPSPARYQVALP